MKLPITTSHTSYVEFDTPCYYQSKWVNIYYKIYNTGIQSVFTEAIHNSYIEADDKVDQYAVNKIREILETGIPITKEEYQEQFNITLNHLNIIAQ